MANNQNLKPVRTKKEARERGRNGGIKSGEARREKATMLSVLEKMLNEVPIKDNEEGLTNRELATLGLIKGANKGNVENYKVIQSLMEKKEQQEQKGKGRIYIPAIDMPRSFVDVYRDIQERGHYEYWLEGGRGSNKSSFWSEVVTELLENNENM